MRGVFKQSPVVKINEMDCYFFIKKEFEILK